MYDVVFAHTSMREHTTLAQIVLRCTLLTAAAAAAACLRCIQRALYKQQNIYDKRADFFVRSFVPGERSFKNKQRYLFNDACTTARTGRWRGGRDVSKIRMVETSSGVLGVVER